VIGLLWGKTSAAALLLAPAITAAHAATARAQRFSWNCMADDNRISFI
jgi:hypothetical protein